MQTDLFKASFLTNDAFILYSFTENLSRRGDVILSQSSLYSRNVASRANDGDINTNFEFCAHTDEGHKKAWFQVDLGTEFNIYSVTIYYRKDSK